MTSVSFKLDAFEGPLDLLLHLITKHKLNIYDIEITELLDQYMNYINNLENEDYEDAADFLEMAARLIYIKTCSLLPQDEEAEDLKKELEGRIIEYSLCKMAAQKLKNRYIGGEVFVREPAKVPVNKTYTREHDPSVLYDAYMGLSEKARKSKPLKADMFEPIVSHKIVSVTSKIIHILKRLYMSGEFDMAHLYDGMKSKSERVATFLAVLELTKSGRIFLNDDNSKIFFNKNSRKKKIESDFDKEDTPETLNFSTQTENEKFENDAVPLDDVVEEAENNDDDFERMEPTYEKYSDYKPKKSMVKYVSEQVNSVQCSVEISDNVQTDEPVMEVEPVQSDENETEPIEDIGICEINSEDKLMEDVVNLHNINSETENTDNEDSSAFAEEVERLKILASLPAEPPVTVFKPNYWKCSEYFWGTSPVGDDSRENCWKFGNMRIR